MRCAERRHGRPGGARDPRPVGAIAPRPGVPIPDRRHQMDRRGIRAAVGHADPDDDVIGRRLGVFHDDVEEAVLVQRARVLELVLGVVAGPARVLLDQRLVREAALRIAVQRLEVRARRRRVEVRIDLLDVLAVVALRPAQPEQPLLQDRIDPVPERQGQVQPSELVADPEEPILAPAVGARPGVVMRQVGPRRAVRGVVLPHGAPLAIREVWTPASPRDPGVARLAQPSSLRILEIASGSGRLRHTRSGHADSVPSALDACQPPQRLDAAARVM